MGNTTTPIGSRLSLWALAALAPALMFVGTSRAVMDNYQTDFWHHLARGRAIVEQGRLVDVDIFTYTVAGEPFRDPNWLTQVVYYRLYNLGGLPLIRLVNSLALSAMMALLVFACWRASRSLPLAAALGVFAFFGLWQLLVVRPQTFSLLLFALLYVVLDLSEQRRRWLFLAPVILALWANLHGAFPIGLYLIGVFFLAAAWDAVLGNEPRPSGSGDRRVRDLAICLVLSLLATGINPYGYMLYSYVDHTASSAAQRNISEWIAPPLNLVIGKVWVASMLLVVVALVLPGRRPRAREVIVVLCFLPLPCVAARMIAWWLLASLPVVAAEVGGWLRNIVLPSPLHRGRGDGGEGVLSFAKTAPSPPLLSPEAGERGALLGQPSPLIGGISLAILVGFVGMTVPGPDRLLRPLPRDGVIEDNLAKLAGRLRQVPGGPRHLFSRFEWGEYLSWALHPDDYRIFADGRIEIYPDHVWNEYLALTHGRGDWQNILDRSQVNSLILDASYPDHANGLLPLVQRSGKWQQVCKAGDAVLFLRVAGARPGSSTPWKRGSSWAGSRE